MSVPYLGEIKMTAFPRVPQGWMPCDGRLLAIAEYDALFMIIGTVYGGDGQTTFALPDLRGRRPVHVGQRDGLTCQIGQLGGTETHTLTAAQIPAHTHAVRAAATGGVTGPADAVWGRAPAGYGAPAGAVMAAASVAPAGNGQPHENRPPYLVVNFVIAVEGIFPTQT